MHTPAQLTSLHVTAKASAQALTVKHEKLKTAIEDIENDFGLNESQREWKVRQLREGVMADIIKHVNGVREVAEQVRHQVRLWESTPYVLSQAKYSDSQSCDAQTKLWKAQEFAAMPTAVLSLAFDDAKAKGDWATVSLCLNARAGRKDEPVGMMSEEFSLKNVDVGGQGEALKALNGINAHAKYAESVFSQISRPKNNGASNLQRAKLQDESESA